MHSFKSHRFNQVLKITVHLNCLLPLLIPKQGKKTYPKQSQISPAHTWVHAHAHRRALIFETCWSSERQVPLVSSVSHKFKEQPAWHKEAPCCADTVPPWTAGWAGPAVTHPHLETFEAAIKEMKQLTSTFCVYEYSRGGKKPHPQWLFALDSLKGSAGYQNQG